MLIAYSTKDVWNSNADDLSVSGIVALFYPTPTLSCLPRRKDLCPIFGRLPSLSDATEPLKPLKPVQVVVLDLFCGRGLVGRACASWVSNPCVMPHNVTCRRAIKCSHCVPRGPLLGFFFDDWLWPIVCSMCMSAWQIILVPRASTISLPLLHMLASWTLA